MQKIEYNSVVAINVFASNDIAKHKWFLLQNVKSSSVVGKYRGKIELLMDFSITFLLDFF